MDYRTAKNTLPESYEVPVVVTVGRIDVGFNQVCKDVDSLGSVDGDVLTMDL